MTVRAVQLVSHVPSCVPLRVHHHFVSHSNLFAAKTGWNGVRRRRRKHRVYTALFIRRLLAWLKRFSSCLRRVSQTEYGQEQRADGSSGPHHRGLRFARRSSGTGVHAQERPKRTIADRAGHQCDRSHDEDDSRPDGRKARERSNGDHENSDNDANRPFDSADIAGHGRTSMVDLHAHDCERHARGTPTRRRRNPRSSTRLRRRRW